MPARLSSAVPKGLLRSTNSAGVFYCPSCATWRRELTTRTNTTSTDQVLPSHRPNRPLNPNPTNFTRPIITSPTISADRTVPSRFKELYDALSGVKDASIEQVSLSRLQLALRGLESETPLIRVAVLGLDSAHSARKLVRLLLADPLGSHESWEDLLWDYESHPSRELLIRYGETSELVPNDLLPTVAVRSPMLKNANLEILVSSLGSEPDSSAATLSAEAFLVPTVTIQTSHSGRHNVVRYPVHRSIVCGSGVDGLLAFSSLMGHSDLKKEMASIRGAIELSVGDEKRSNDRLSFVDINRAATALDRIRESVQNASEYERGWNGSGVQPVIDWLVTLQPRDKGQLNPALVPLVESLLDTAHQGVLARDEEAIQNQTAAVVSEAVRSDLEREIANWAERAHSELQSELEAGFASPRWRGLAWWKLFWRVDDVSMVTSEILEKNFLHRAEREVIWNTGKYEQAGLLDHPNSPALESARIQPTTAPWPSQISDMRSKLLTTTVPSLQALAQRLVLFSVSTTALSSALSALTYLSIPSASVYESCTLAAIGLVYSLRRQQTKWDTARVFWEDEVREDGRTALRETESIFREIVREGGKPVEDVTDTQAREAIDRARKALEDVLS